MINKKSKLIVSLVFLATNLSVHAGSAEDLFKAFSQCDQSFFEKLAAEKAEWSTVMKLGELNHVAYPYIKNRLRESEREQQFATPIKVNGIDFISYSDTVEELAGVGKFLFWGFMVKGNPDAVAKKLKPLVFDSQRLLKSSAELWGRSEVRYAGDDINQWRTEGATGSGTVAKQGSVERVFIIESADEKYGQGMTTITCSLQGSLTSVLLEKMRPDLDEKSMP